MPATTTSLSREDIEQQAALWTARLESDQLAAAQHKELADWLAADPAHREVLTRYRELTARLTAQVPVLMDAAEVAAIVAQANRGRRIRRTVAPLLAAAAAVTVGLFVWRAQPEEFETHGAERRAFTLADGSRIELNARTGLQVKLRGSERRVKFGRGEAYFQVAHDPARPFFVETPQGLVRVTGTVFNVRETAGAAVEVTVLEGSVQVTPRADAATPAALAGGQQAALDPERASVRVLSEDETQNIVAWRVGQAAFQDAPLDDALARFAPYHPGAITVDPGAATLRVGGRYSLDDLDGFLAAIEQALPVVVLRGDGGTVRVIAHQHPRK
ncbi:MAG: FecR domain-containing protein [Opitutae bacterium]|nr:FecR domain-containing protein [Opitutae bacterium]